MEQAFEIKMDAQFTKLKKAMDKGLYATLGVKVRDAFLPKAAAYIGEKVALALADPEQYSLDDLTDEWQAEKEARGWSDEMWQATGVLMQTVQVRIATDSVFVGWDNSPHPHSKTPLAEIARSLEKGVPERDQPARPLMGSVAYASREDLKNMLRETMLEQLNLIMRS